MADYSSTTRLTLGLDALRSGSGDKLLRAVQRAVAADYEVLGEMGRGAQGRIVYLAREAATRHLVALQLSPPAGNGPPVRCGWTCSERSMPRSPRATTSARGAASGCAGGAGSAASAASISRASRPDPGTALRWTNCSRQ